MVQKNFSIYGDAGTAARLYVELGNRYLASWCIAETGKLLNAFEMFVYDEQDLQDPDELLRVIALQSKLFDQSFIATTFIWNNLPAVIVPSEFYNDELATEYLALETGQRITAEVKAEPVENVVVAYHLPAGHAAAAARYFPAAPQVHKKALLYSYAQQLMAATPVAHLAFYQGEVTLLLTNNGKVQLLQCFPYANAADVLYQLFNCLQQAGAPKESTIVYIGGLIDTGSSLYKELAMYVNNLQLASLAEDAVSKPVFSEYPSHYFSPFYSLVL